MTKSLAPQILDIPSLLNWPQTKKKKKQFLFSEILSMTHSELDVHT